MKITKRGLIYCPKGEHGYDKHSFMCVAPILLNDEVIRIYGTTRDEEGVGRIIYIDVNAANPSEIIYISPKPVLDIGEPGCFDDHGVAVTEVIKVGNKFYLYYSGFTIPQKVKFIYFSGLAISDDGISFERYSQVPVMERTNTARLGRTIQNVVPFGDKYLVYYVVMNSFSEQGGLMKPSYDIWCTVSPDGILMPNVDDNLVLTMQEDEYRLGRSKVYPRDDGYEMFVSSSLKGFSSYKMAYATSKDGFNWERRDSEFDLRPSGIPGDWESDAVTYPVKLTWHDQNYLFYNGNDFGRTGLGYATIKY
jgi:predicted GH43/DUF377 family glycosyl hydrolase